MRLDTLERRRSTELALGVLALVITAVGYLLVFLAEKPEIPGDFGGLVIGLVGLYAVAHLAVRRLAPRADAVLLPIAVLLNGVGFVVITRLDRDRPHGASALAPTQAVWSAVGVAAFVLVLLLVRRTRSLERYRYTFLLLGVAAILLPLAPSIGNEVNGARLWVHLGPLNFQPGEAAKVLLVVFFAAYLADRRELLASGSRRSGRFFVPEARHLGPLLVPWIASIVVMVREKDLGSSLLFFAVFVAMLYVATNRAWYLAAGAALFVAGAAVAYQLFGHVQVRVSTWIDPWPVAKGNGYQIVQSLFAFGTGGFAGRGLGLGSPQKIPAAATDFIFAAIGEELGLIGTVAVILAVLLLVGAAFRVAIQAERPFSKLFAAGLATVLGVQTFVIVGGVTRFIPLTGVTLPFVSYGGSSLVANFVIVALLLRISDETAAEALAPRPSRHAAAARASRSP